MIIAFISSALKKLSKRIELSISELTGLPIQVNLKSKDRKTPEELIATLSRNELIVAIHSVLIEQDTHVILLLNLGSARKISKILLLQAEMELSDEEALDALREFGNIVFGTLASEISEKTNSKVTYTIPDVVIDYDVAILESLIVPLAMVKESIDILNFNVSSGVNDELDFEMLILPGDGV